MVSSADQYGATCRSLSAITLTLHIGAEIRGVDLCRPPPVVEGGHYATLS